MDASTAAPDRIPEPRIRPYAAGDAGPCRRILEVVLPAFGLNVDFEGTDRDLLDVDASYLAGGGAFWVVEAPGSGRVIGMGGLHRVAPDTGEVRKMYFLPELRGRGFGRKLLDTAVGFARERGIRTLTLETASVLGDAIRLYERYGFTSAPELLRTKRCNLAYRYDVPAG